MTRYRLTNVLVPRRDTVRLTFSDGFEGDLDLSDYVRRGPYFAPLADEVFFRQVAIAENGRSFGWRLDRLGEEIDFGADAARADIETALVEQRAERFRRRQVDAAE